MQAPHQEARRQWTLGKEFGGTDRLHTGRREAGQGGAVDDAGLFVEKGFFFPREYGFRFDDVADVRDDGVHLRLKKEAISSALLHDVGGLERSRPSAVSEDREPKASGLATDPREGAADLERADDTPRIDRAEPDDRHVP